MTRDEAIVLVRRFVETIDAQPPHGEHMRQYSLHELFTMLQEHVEPEILAPYLTAVQEHQLDWSVVDRGAATPERAGYPIA